MEARECQLHSLRSIQEPMSRTEYLWQYRHRLKHAARRRAHYARAATTRLLARSTAAADMAVEAAPFEPGDRVRVRSAAEIRSTLDDWKALGGCGFMEEMTAYCGTEQTVLKQVRRFLDESDYRVKRVRDRTYLLEDALCEGTADWGPCDRACFFFWREEWLEKA